MPAVRGRLTARFGEDRVVGGEELTSVAWSRSSTTRAKIGGESYIVTEFIDGKTLKQVITDHPLAVRRRSAR